MPQTLDFFKLLETAQIVCLTVFTCLAENCIKPILTLPVYVFRGIQLGRPELVKTWEKFEQKKSFKAEKVEGSELESRFRSISQKQEVSQNDFT